MNDLTRRGFLTRAGVVAGAGAALVAVPAVAGPAAVVAMSKPKRVELSRVQAGDAMTVSYQNAIVDRLNELSDAIR